MPPSGILLDAFKLKPADAIAFLKAKGNKFSWNWYDTWKDANSRSFTVAKAMKADVLKAIRSEVTKAIEGDWFDVVGPDGATTRIKRGLTLQEFQKRLKPQLKTLGWWGKGVDDQGKEIQLGSPYRLRTIYRTNIQTSYMAGRYKQQTAAVGGLPYWQYVAIMDAKTRPAHRALDGKVFPADDPFWDTHYPPNGWGCRCRVRPLTRSALDREGLKVEDSDGKFTTKEEPIGSGDERKLVKVTGYKTTNAFGQPVTVYPDAGWDYNPGKSAYPPGLSLDAGKPPPKTPKPVFPLPPAATGSVPSLPTDTAGLSTIKNLGGSTGAVLVQDKAGAQFVMKKGAGAVHIREEALADDLYAALGVDVPEHTLIDAPGGPVKISRFIDGTPLSKLRGAKRTAAVTRLREGFSTDAFLANHDVIGLDEDNILVDKVGKVWRIDNGGVLRFRAQGKEKAGFDAYPMELWTLRDKDKNKATATLFGALTHSDIVKQSEALLAKRETVLNLVKDKELKSILAARLDNMQDMVNTSRTFMADKWVDDYTGGFTRNVMGIKKAGVSALLPKRLSKGHKSQYVVYDENGVKWDKMRGEGSSISKLAHYMGENGGDYKLLGSWLSAQSGSSWSSESIALKYWYATQRSLNPDAFYWRGSLESAKRQFESLVGRNLQKYSNTMQTYHAYTYELLRTADIDYVNRAAGTVRLMRTEDKTVLSAHKVKRGAEGTLKRGVLESTSIYRKTAVRGSEVTVQDVPLQRVFGTYFHSQTPGGDGCAFYGDSENEFVAFLDGVKLRYDPGYVNADGYVRQKP